MNKKRTEKENTKNAVVDETLLDEFACFVADRIKPGKAYDRLSERIVDEKTLRGTTDEGDAFHAAVERVVEDLPPEDRPVSGGDTRAFEAFVRRLEKEKETEAA